jgi:hypothetical protein
MISEFQCLTVLQNRESNVNALMASLLAFLTLFTFSHRHRQYNGVFEQGTSLVRAGLQLRDSP